MAPTKETRRRSQIIKIDFYKVLDEGVGRVEFQNALRAAIGMRGSNRSREVRGERIDLYECHETGSIIEGEIGRVSMDDIPAIANAHSSVNELPLNDDQGVTHRTAFLYDSSLSILVLHAKREAVSASRIAGYCDCFSGNGIDSFTVNPILRPDAAQKLQSMNVIKKIVVGYSRGASGLIANPDPSTSTFVRDLDRLNGETMIVSVSSGRKKENQLSFQDATNLIQSALTERSDVVQKLVISGKNAGDEALLIDLLEDRLRVPVIIKFSDRVLSYQLRKRAVRQAYDSSLSILQ